ncbi:type II and III secretion system protein family protein [Erythrobacter sp. LQ02-29]|uniref:type II and III secretion system protein family protein n=1 Tax=Erythrobacter sp. LQ02-29 TaxID=2920384 RepID=UPI001F4EDE34|nr:type II and III secretion system protein family protein [Erythrobacter sp. LQ02-29]MCP9222481.1 type II and III secretion system protein family protein [Erythrobacter sp. LQ02-29]
MTHRILARALALGIAALPLAALPAASANAQSIVRPSQDITLSIGRGELVSIPATLADVFVANSEIADVQVKSQHQLYLLGKAGGETTVYASDAKGQVVWAANVRVGSNIGSIDQMLALAMPEAKIATANIGSNTVLLTGTVTQPDDVAEAERLVAAFLGDQTNVISRLRMATPLQVNLQVRFAEVSRSLVREIGSNLKTRDTTDGFMFGVNRGRNFGNITDIDVSNLPVVDASAQFGLPAGSISLPFDPVTRQFVLGGSAFPIASNNVGQTAITLAGRLFGLDISQAFDLGERLGLISTLSAPNLTAISGETATFLAGGEFPIPLNQGFGQTTIEFKKYGVSLEYTPVVLSDGRISLRVRPEVSELSSQNAVSLGGFQVPSLTTRRAETTVELGSGQSFMIAGLMTNNMQNQIEKTPGLGDVPVLGNLFRSSDFRRGETELVIVVTPYLVKPVDAKDIVLPTDGFHVPDELQRNTIFKSNAGVSGEQRPGPVQRDADAVGAPVIGQQPPAAQALPPQNVMGERKTDPNAAPGFSMK